MAPGALVCTGTWRLRTRQAWALGDVTEGPAPPEPMWPGYDFRAEGKEACRGQPGVGLKGTWRHFQWAIEKEARSDRMPSPCQCILSEPGVLLGGSVHLLLLFCCLLNPDTGGQSRPMGMCPCGAESQVGKKDMKPEATN